MNEPKDIQKEYIKQLYKVSFSYSLIGNVLQYGMMKCKDPTDHQIRELYRISNDLENLSMLLGKLFEKEINENKELKNQN